MTTNSPPEKDPAAWEQERRKKELRLQGLGNASCTAALEVEAAMLKLKKMLQGFLAIGRERYALSASLGCPDRRELLEEVAGAYLRWELHWLLPHHFPRPPYELRRPLTHLVSPMMNEAAIPARTWA